MTFRAIDGSGTAGAGEAAAPDLDTLNVPLRGSEAIKLLRAIPDAVQAGSPIELRLRSTFDDPCAQAVFDVFVDGFIQPLQVRLHAGGAWDVMARIAF